MGATNSQTDTTVALDTFIKLMRAAESVSSDVHRDLVQAGLSISQFGVLEVLCRQGPMSQKDLAGKILKSAGTLTMVINNLEKRRLVTRDRSSADRRSYRISPTPEGKALIAALFPAHADRITARMSTLRRQEQKTLGRLLKKLGRPVSE